MMKFNPEKLQGSKPMQFATYRDLILFQNCAVGLNFKNQQKMLRNSKPNQFPQQIPTLNATKQIN